MRAFVDSSYRAMLLLWDEALRIARHLPDQLLLLRDGLALMLYGQDHYEDADEEQNMYDFHFSSTFA